MESTVARRLRYAADSDRPLAKNTKHSLASAYALAIHGSAAIYTFIPKNGCSTMRLSLALANGAIASAADINWIHSNNFTFSATLGELLTARYTFAIIRCPFSRLASCYLDKIVGRDYPFWHLHHALKRQPDPNEYTFRRFVTALAEDEDVREADEHWRPQTDFLVYEHYDDLLDFHDFAAIKARLAERIGFEVHDARAHTRHGIDGLTRVEEAGPDTAPLDILRMRTEGRVPDPRTLFDDEIVAALAEVYRDDIALMRETFPQRLMFDPSTGAG